MNRLVSAVSSGFLVAIALSTLAEAGPRRAAPAYDDEAIVLERELPYGGGFVEMLMTGREPTGRHYREAPLDPLTGFPYDPRGSVGSRSRGAITAIPDYGDSYGSEDDYIDDGIGFGVAPRYQRQVVAYNGPHAPGTIIIDTPSRFLYLVQPGKRAIRYGIGVGRPGFTWAGRKTVTMKRKWPDWRPPAEMLRRRPDLPRYMSGGLDNPLGARALYLGSSLYRIHGTNEPHTIGHAVSSGCIRMLNSDVVDLYNRVKVGTPVIVI
jgi:lipoprotein-anchoring transpeptidase ErfK/SrfK